MFFPRGPTDIPHLKKPNEQRCRDHSNTVIGENWREKERLMAVETEVATTPELVLADTGINWDRLRLRLDKTRFHMIGVILFTAQQGLLHPTAVVKTRMQVADSGLSHMGGVSIFTHVSTNDGIHGIYRDLGTSAIGSLPGGVLALTSLEVSKDVMLKYTEGVDMPEATTLALQMEWQACCQI